MYRWKGRNDRTADIMLIKNAPFINSTSRYPEGCLSIDLNIMKNIDNFPVTIVMNPTCKLEIIKNNGICIGMCNSDNHLQQILIDTKFHSIRSYWRDELGHIMNFDLPKINPGDDIGFITHDEQMYLLLNDTKIPVWNLYGNALNVKNWVIYCYMQKSTIRLC